MIAARSRRLGPSATLGEHAILCRSSVADYPAKLVYSLTAIAAILPVTPNASAQRRAETVPAKHDNADPRVRCSRKLEPGFDTEPQTHATDYGLELLG